MAKPIKKLTHQEILRAKPSVERVRGYLRLPVILVLDNLRSLYNIGSIFRTADALLIEKIFLCGICGKLPNREIEKVALGAVQTVPYEYVEKAEECVAKLKADGRKIVVLELTDSSVNYREAKYEVPMALVVGNEIDGVSEAVMRYADLAMDIPMGGRANSLNVATATAVVGYEIAAQVKIFKK